MGKPLGERREEAPSRLSNQPSGAPVDAAKVSIENGATTYTDPLGYYRLSLPTAGDTLTVVASDGYTPGVSYGETSYGSVRFVPRRSLMVINIVLDHSTPI